MEAVCFSVVLREEEEELSDLWGVAVAQRYHRPSDSVWPSLALISVGSEDAVCTKAAAVPGRNNHNNIP